MISEQEKQKIRKLKIAFIGRPGTGKGTQVQKLYQKTQMIIIPSPGDIYRDPEFRKTDVGKKAGQLVDQGEFVPNEITNQIMKEKISFLTNNLQQGFISEGYPRTIPQAEFTDKEIGLDWMINLEVSEKDLLERLSQRRYCPACKKNYNFITTPPKNDSLCDDCRLALVQRDDDRPEVIRNRFEVYHQTAEPTIDHYRRQNKIIDINGNQSIEMVAQDVLKALLDKII